MLQWLAIHILTLWRFQFSSTCSLASIQPIYDWSKRCNYEVEHTLIVIIFLSTVVAVSLVKSEHTLIVIIFLSTVVAVSLVKSEHTLIVIIFLSTVVAVSLVKSQKQGIFFELAK